MKHLMWRMLDEGLSHPFTCAFSSGDPVCRSFPRLLLIALIPLCLAVNRVFAGCLSLANIPAMHPETEEGVNREQLVMHFPCRFTVSCLSAPSSSFHFSRSTTSLPSTRPEPDLTPDPGGSDSTELVTETDLPTAGTVAHTVVSGRSSTTDSVNRSSPSTRKPSTRRQTTERTEQETQYFTTASEFTTTTTYEADMRTYSSTGISESRTMCREEEPQLAITDDDLLLLEEEKKEKLRTLCWETMFGQELTKMTVMDLMTTAFGIIVGDFLRALIVRYIMCTSP